MSDSVLHVAPGCTWVSLWWRMEEQPPRAGMYMIMHHTYFWEEFIDRAGRPCGRVVNISHCTSDLLGRSSLCVIVRVSFCELVDVQDWVCGTCVGVCVWVGGWAAFLSIKVTSGPPSASGEKWTVPSAPSRLALLLCHHFLLIHPEWDRHTSLTHNTATGIWHMQ